MPKQLSTSPNFPLAKPPRVSYNRSSFCFQGAGAEELMEFRVDAKGKYFTTHVSKQSVPVVARVQDSIIQGAVHLAPDNRLKDELNGSESFIAVTDAQVLDANSQRVVYSTPILILNKSRIDWIFPLETTQSPSEPNA
jgi:hypothetical protein